MAGLALQEIPSEFVAPITRETSGNPFLLHVCCDGALMEARLGSDSDRAIGRRRLDHAREWVELIVLPKLLPRIDDGANKLWS